MDTYPKKFWVLTRAEVVLENGAEVINHACDHLIGGTFDPQVALALQEILKKNRGPSTLFRSSGDVTLEETAQQNQVDQLLSMVTL